MGGAANPGDDAGAALLAAYDTALPRVYGYLVSRCGQHALAEDLTADTLLAAVDAIRRTQAPPISVAWLIGIARHKLVDYWRRQAREERGLHAVALHESIVEDTWDAELDALRAQEPLWRNWARSIASS